MLILCVIDCTDFDFLTLMLSLGCNCIHKIMQFHLFEHYVITHHNDIRLCIIICVWLCVFLYIHSWYRMLVVWYRWAWLCFIAPISHPLSHGRYTDTYLPTQCRPSSTWPMYHAEICMWAILGSSCLPTNCLGVCMYEAIRCCGCNCVMSN